MNVSFRPLRRDDLALLSTWLAAPHVAAWWREDPAPEAVEARYGPSIDGHDPTELFIAMLDDRPVGMVQRYLLDDYPSWAATLDMGHAAGIDYLIGVEELTGVGLGGRMIDVFTDLTFDRYPDIDRLAVAVQQSNRPSWRVLEKTGFTRVFAGTIESRDPSDEGPSYIYVRLRPEAEMTTVSAP
jgi:aminoglycoside 6'-N-acetyltransferase